MCISYVMHVLYIYIYIFIYITARHFRRPCAIFADPGVFKIRITILKSMQFVAILWDFRQITSNHQSNTKNNISKYDFFEYQIYQVPWNSMEFHGTSKKVPWNTKEFHGTYLGKIKGSMEFHGIPWNSGVWKKFHGLPWNFGSGQNSTEFHGIPWNLRFCWLSSMEFHGTTGVVQMLFKKFHGTLEKIDQFHIRKNHISKYSWNRNSTGNVQDIHLWYEFENYRYKITTLLPGTKELVNNLLCVPRVVHKASGNMWLIRFKMIRNSSSLLIRVELSLLLSNAMENNSPQ